METENKRREALSPERVFWFERGDTCLTAIGFLFLTKQKKEGFFLPSLSTLSLSTQVRCCDFRWVDTPLSVLIMVCDF